MPPHDPAAALALFVTTPKGMETLLAEELRMLGAASVRETRAGVAAEGTLETAYRACLWSRTANRVLLPLAHFAAPSPEALYDGVQAIAWDEHLAPTGTLAVDFTTTQSAITHSHYGALKVKDAVVDQMRARHGDRPSIDVEQPDVRINVYLHRDEATLSLDLSGESLHRRGYRERGVAAPLKENLAAAILLRAGWPEIAHAGGRLVDPMCGSGTLPIEAAFMAADIAPGINRSYFGFLRWRLHQPSLWQTLLDDARARRSAGLARLPAIRAYDRDARAIRAALGNINRAGLADHIRIERRELEAGYADSGPGPGLVIVNPPYGERIGAESELPELYRLLGAQLKQYFPGWRAAVFTGNPDLGKNLGLRARRMHMLFNGAIECKLLHFDITPEWFISGETRPRPVAPEARGPGAEQFANRLHKNLKHLGRWAKREDICCYRLYDADMPEYALAIDIYHGEQRWVHAQEYQAPSSIDPHKARQRLREALSVIPEVLEIAPAQLFFKVRRQQKGPAQYEKLAEEGHFHEVREHGCRLLVNFTDYLDTGLFLDHRITRAKIESMARGKRFLNLFGYTGAATVHAAHGGAASTTTVDMSKTYLAWAERNLLLNGFPLRNNELIHADCMSWLEIEDSAGRRSYDLIFLDPPTFSTSKRMAGTLDIQRDHVALVRAALKLLAANGTLIFSNNLQRFKMDLAALADLDVTDITHTTLPKDFERNPKIHNCWTISMR